MCASWTVLHVIMEWLAGASMGDQEVAEAPER